MRRILPLIFALVCLPISARGEDCVSNAASFSWAAVTGGTWTGCTASADDTFTIASGHTVTITGSITGSGANAITVESGGTLLGEVSSTQIVVTVGTGGMACEEGSVCRFAGKVRTYGAAAAGLLDAPSSTAYFQAGDMFPCPGDSASSYDCATDGDQMRFSYTIAAPTSDGDWAESDVQTAAAPSQKANFTTNFDAMTANDVICFFDPDTSDNYANPDDNNCYEVNNDPGSGTPSPRVLDFDIQQGAEDTAGYALATRAIRSGVTTAAVTAGQRQIVFDAGTTDGLITADMQRAAFWMRFAVSGATTAPAQSQAYLIGWTKEGGGYATNDTFLIAEKAGIADSHASGDRVWTMPAGWRTGDPFYAMVPFRLVSASATDATAALFQFHGTVTLRNVVLQRPSAVYVGSETTTGEIEDFSRVWIQDPVSDSTDAALVVENRSGTIQQLNITGGSDGTHVHHGIIIGCSDNLTLQDVAQRYGADDYYVYDDQNACNCGSGGCSQPVASSNVTTRRVAAEFMAQGAGTSGGLADMQDDDSSATSRYIINAVNMKFEDAYCGACGLPDGSVIMDIEGGIVRPQRVVVVGVQGPISGNRTESFDDLMVIGSIVPEVAGFNWLFTKKANRFVGRDLENRRLTSVANLVTSQTGSTGPIDLRNGYFDDVTIYQPNLSAIVADNNGGTVNIQNVGIYNVKSDGTSNTCASSCGALVATKATGVNLENITAAFSPQVASARRYLSFLTAPTSIGTYNVGGLLAEGFTGAASAYNWNWSTGYDTATFSGPLCAFNNSSDLSAQMRNSAGTTAFIESYATVIRDRSPQFVNPYAGRFFPHPSGVFAENGCGTRLGAAAPGVHRIMWPATRVGLTPEFQADSALAGASGGSSLPRPY